MYIQVHCIFVLQTVQLEDAWIVGEQKYCIFFFLHHFSCHYFTVDLEILHLYPSTAALVVESHWCKAGMNIVYASQIGMFAKSWLFNTLSSCRNIGYRNHFRCSPKKFCHGETVVSCRKSLSQGCL